jgi:hypothetical protein
VELQQTDWRSDLVTSLRILAVALVLLLAVSAIASSGAQALTDARAATCWTTRAVGVVPQPAVRVACADQPQYP